MSSVGVHKRILIGGGVRSGKSAFALARARQLGARRAFVATARGVDDDMRARIARHQQERGADFTTIEEPIALAHVLAGLAETEVVVVDCVTLWLANLLLRGDDESTILRHVDALVEVLRAPRFDVILVTNEVGMGVHPEQALGRAFRDVAGRAHQRLARGADEIYFAVLGMMLRLRPGPVKIEPFTEET
ncbi:MAG TPA: bifunctional adenosylcobinamide kinase/adenosylcobinamide-phosphate guanylyltransferase [Candidatus Acidoferrales bacterium]|nr:bifunctional adenosylcobinamide kinase/adenosylcobinamide-phosphate guanylyltransferase [Candidatus Acidoferrales bacterium]